jgi:hypothetical protein
MKEFAIKVKDVKEFTKTQQYIYASGAGKRFFVSLHAGPNVERYIVEINGQRKGFTNVGDAVRYFNAG